MVTRAPRSTSCTFYRPETYQPDESAAYLMRRILTLMAAQVDEALEASGLTHAQWMPLLKLHMGAPATVAEIARECQMDAGAMTRLLDRLEAKGLLSRVRSSEDRRVVNLELTKEGREAARHIPAVLCKVQNAFLQGFTVQEWQQLRGLLQRVHANGLALQGQTQEQE